MIFILLSVLMLMGLSVINALSDNLSFRTNLDDMDDLVR